MDTAVEHIQFLYIHLAANHMGVPKVMIDVGANTGIASAPFSRDHWKTYCFEPNDEVRAVLKNNTAALANVTIDPGLFNANQIAL